MSKLFNPFKILEPQPKSKIFSLWKEQFFVAAMGIETLSSGIYASFPDAEDQ